MEPERIHLPHNLVTIVNSAIAVKGKNYLTRLPLHVLNPLVLIYECVTGAFSQVSINITFIR